MRLASSIHFRTAAPSPSKPLVEVEASSGVSPDDPALLALKSIVLQKIAYLELAKAEIASLPESQATDSQLEGASVWLCVLECPRLPLM